MKLLKNLKDMKLSRFLAIGVAFTLFGSGIGYAAGEWENIWVQFDSVNLTVNGQNVTSSNLLYNDRTYVPLRACAEMLGGTVGWDQNTNTASITGGSDIDAVKMKAAAQLMEKFNQITEVGLRMEICICNFNEYYGFVIENHYGKEEFYNKYIAYFNDTITLYNTCISYIDDVKSQLQLLNTDDSKIEDMLEYYGMSIDKLKLAYDKVSQYNDNPPFTVGVEAVDARNEGIEFIKTATQIKTDYITHISAIIK